MQYDKLYIHTDGGSRGNPGLGAIAVVIKDENGKTVEEYSRCIGETTNNRAEYSAIIKALEFAVKLCKKWVIIFSDSENSVKQLQGINKVKDKELLKLFQNVKEKEKCFESVTYTHVKRDDNKRADKLVNEALDKVKF